MLWTLLTATSSVTFIASAVLSARHAQVGFGSYVLAITIGLLLGTCNAVTMYKVAGSAEVQLRHHSESLQRWCFNALYVAAALWILFAAFLGEWAATVALRLVAGRA
jgi:hypothetical protein